MDNDYSFSIASTEIIVALAAAFIAGALLCYLLRLLGLCCRRPKVEEVESNTRQVHMEVNQAPLGETADFRADFPIPPVIERTPVIQPQTPTTAPAVAEETPVNRLSVEGGAYEADINTLLRRGSPDAGSTIPLPENTAGSSSFADRARESLGTSVSPVAAPAPAIEHTDNDLVMPDDDHIDDLKKLEGIGPRIETLLNRHNIKSYARLATMDRDRLRDILELGGKEFKMHEPKSWPYQAELAAKENWDRLREYQEFLLEGRAG